MLKVIGVGREETMTEARAGGGDVGKDKGWLVTVDHAVKILMDGGVVALPTETVYGLAGLAYCSEAIIKIYDIKKRPRGNPLIVHYANWQETCEDVVWTPWALELAQRVWPGPLTFILPLKPCSRMSPELTAGHKTLAVRVPQHPLMRQVLIQCRGPLAAPSANPSGRISPTRAWHVLQELAIPVLDGGPCVLGLESTIIDATGDRPRLLRHGAWDGERDIDNFLIKGGKDEEAKTITPPPPAPGTLFQHYAPRKKIRINAREVYTGEGLIAFGEPCDYSPWTVQLSESRCLRQAACNFFQALYFLDKQPCESIAIMTIPNEGIGKAINERVGRAVGLDQ